MNTVAQVVIPRPLSTPLSYLIPDELKLSIQIGSYVQVPFRSKVSEGYVVGFESSDVQRNYKLKEIICIPVTEPVFSQKDLDFFNWIAQYYQLPIGEVFYSAFPKAVFDIPKKEQNKKQMDDEVITSPSLVKLTADQQECLSKIYSYSERNIYKPFLLFGVTGSGKTEVYIRAAQKVLAENKSALILVPEIALTPQLRKRFEERFSNQVAVLHSSLTAKVRRNFWWDILNGRRKVVVGARSALFAPLKNIGLIVVDEEHEPSYKQEDRLRYNARDLALVRAKQHNAIALLGSATPSIESYFSAQNNKYELLTLNSRPSSRPMPEIEIVDLKSMKSLDDKRILFSHTMQEGIASAIMRHEQCMIFVNRKGYSSFLLCKDCGAVPTCLNCSVSLTYYWHTKKLRCHYCAFEKNAPESCDQCGSFEMKYMGIGTELVEQELKQMFPSTVIGRLDADTANTIKKLEATLEKFRNGEIQILVGTQMLAKGHDFPNVTFIGVVLADLNLHLPDFRASERTFQLLTQVSGRAGRGDKPGRVVLQTFLPDHYVIQAAAKQDYLEFYRNEIQYRADFQYPPYAKIAQVEFRNLNDEKAKNEATRARDLLEHLLNSRREEIVKFSYLGPATASIARIANQFRWQILLKSEKSSELNAVIKTLRKEGVRFIDVDPVSTL